MGSKIQEIITKIKDFLEFIFHSAAENHIRIAKDGAGRFQSFTQLKKYQQRLRKFAASALTALIFIFIGILVGPAFLNQTETHEVYIPDGKGDILISNISKNQATIVFKTLDSLHQNDPLATMAEVAVYRDSEHRNLVQKFRSTDYAVTHVISVDGLEEGNTYYILISASEDKELRNAKKTSVWGDAKPLTIYAAGETPSSCAIEITKINEENNRIEESEEASLLSNHEAEELSEIQTLNTTTINQPEKKDESLKILQVKNENYLYGRDKLQVIISWRTSIPATTKLIYRYDDKGEKSQELNISEEKELKHVAVLTSLKTETKYYFRVVSATAQGETAISEEYSLQTPHPKDNILDILSKNLKGIVHQIGL